MCCVFARVLLLCVAGVMLFWRWWWWWWCALKLQRVCCPTAYTLLRAASWVRYVMVWVCCVGRADRAIMNVCMCAMGQGKAWGKGQVGVVP